MTIHTNTDDRRTLVRLISEHMQTEAVYQRAPTYAYTIGTLTVDRDGNIVCEDERVTEDLRAFLMDRGYIRAEADAPPEQEPTEPEADTPELEHADSEVDAPDQQPTEPEADAPEHEPAESGADAPEHEPADFEADAPEQQPTDSEVDTPEQQSTEPAAETLSITVPTTGMECSQLRNLVYMLHAYEYLLNRATRGETFLVSEDVMTHLEDSTPVSAADFVSVMKNFAWVEKLKGVDFRADEVTLTFPMDQSSEKNTAYAALTSAIVDAARAAKRVDATERRPANEKYVLRSWLVRLGLGGADSRAVRGALLYGLKGHTAFPNEAAAEKHKAKYAEIRKIAREEREDSE